jgi:hypothetical protein
MAILLALVAVLLALILAILFLKLRPLRAIPDRATPGRLDQLLRPRLAGSPADGSAPRREQQPKVIWVDHGDEVVVHLDSLRTLIAGETVLVSLDLETDETGRASIVVPFAVGSRPEGGLTFVTEELPLGPEALVRRWGEAVQQATYAALLDLAEAHAAERGGLPGALYAKDGSLRLRARAGE